MDLKNLVLRPNCLLTKAPLVFLTGPRSLFFFKKLGENLQEFMAAHGYQVISVPMPFRASAHRKLAFSNWRERQTCMNGFHFIMGPATFSEFESQLQLVPNSSVTIIGNHFPILKFNFWQIPFRYRVHQWVCKLSKVKPERYEHTLTASDPLVYDRFLDHCVELAEDEVMGAQQ